MVHDASIHLNGTYDMYAYKIKVLSTTYTNNILRIPDNQLMDKPHNNKDILLEIRIGG